MKAFRHRTKLNQHFFTVVGIVLTLAVLACPARTVEPSPIPRAIEPPSEYELKAIYLYNFLQFVEFPKEACRLPEGHSYEIVVIGNTSLQPVLESLQAKLREQNKKLSLVFHGSYKAGMDLSRCCLLFIASSERHNLPKILNSLDGKHVLTVGDTHDFEDSGVMITMLSREKKVRWAVNRKPVADAGLKMSVKLLEIAERVIE